MVNFFSQHDEICMMKPALIIQLVPANSCLVIGGLSVQICSKTYLWARSLTGLSQHGSADLIGMHKVNLVKNISVYLRIVWIASIDKTKLTNKRDISYGFQCTSFSFTDVFIFSDCCLEECLKSALQQFYFWKVLGAASHTVTQEDEPV